MPRQNLPGSRIDVTTADAGLDCGDCGRLRVLHRTIPSSDARRGPPYKYGAGNVAAIVAEYSTQVQHDQFIFPQSLGGGPCMRVGGALSKSHDGFESPSGSPALPHLVLTLAAHLQSPDPRLHHLPRLLQTHTPHSPR